MSTTADILSRDTARRMQQVIAGLQIIEIANRGHTPTLEEPVAQEAIDGFLRRLS